MDDLISRQAAIDVIDNYMNKCIELHYLPTSDGIKRLISVLPSAQPEPIWGLPVSADRPLADVEIIPRLRQIQAGIPGGDYAIDRAIEVIEAVQALPSAHSEWNNHTVACMLADLFNDTCACNYNGIDEWLPEKCEVIDACPNPVGVACWEQFLKHRAERRTDGQDD